MKARARPTRYTKNCQLNPADSAAAQINWEIPVLVKLLLLNKVEFGYLYVMVP